MLQRLTFRAVLLLAACVALAGCQRGCLATWLEQTGLFGGERGAGARSTPGGFALSGVDCPDGLARCEGGIVEVSRPAHIPPDCRGSANECACPWQSVGSCGGKGCVKDDLEMVLSPSLAATQLCAAPGEVFARPAPVGAVQLPAACEEGVDFLCVEGAVIACDDTKARSAGVCILGCAESGLQIDEKLSDDEAAAILCKRPSGPSTAP
jgi:hypothetical protein